MSGFFILVWLVTLIAFIVYWWKKRKARIAAGEGYKDDPTYQQVSKVKRIIGAVCILSFIIAGATGGQTPEEKAAYEAKQKAKAENQPQTTAG